MKLSLSIVFFASLAALAVATSACDPDPDALGPKDGKPGGDGDDEQPAAGLTCDAPPADARSYVGFDGSKLEAKRENENISLNRARVKPFASLEKEFKRVLGVAPASLKTAASSFETAPARWYAEPMYSSVSLYGFSKVAFDACVAYVGSKPAFASAPTAEAANTECGSLMRKAWSRTPSPDELGACVELATTKLADEKNVARRWAYTCASVISSSQFLTY